MSREPEQSIEEHKLLSNILHLISQPMTALQCSLEFALNTLDDSSQCRSWIEAALENSERLRCRLSLAREIAETPNPGDASQATELRSVLEEALRELDPVFQEAGATPQLRCEEVTVACERSRLLRAFLYVLQNLRIADNRSSFPPEIWVERKQDLIEVRCLRFVLREDLHKDQVASHLAVAKDTFESTGGGLMFFCFAGNDALVRIFLGAPPQQLDLYEQTARLQPAASAIGTTGGFPQVS